MRNLILNSIYNEALRTDGSISLFVYLDEMNHYIVILKNDMKIEVYEYSLSSEFQLIEEIELESLFSPDSNYLKNLMEAIEQNKNPIKFLIYKGENNEVTVAFENGAIISIREKTANVQLLTKNKTVQLIAMESSPNQEYIIAVMSNYELFFLNYANFEVISTCQLDDNDLSDITKDNSLCAGASISWKGSSDLFAVLYQINGGHKCLVRDLKLSVVKGPARADNKIVYSVAEAPLDYMSNVFSFQPNGSLIAFFNHKANTIFFSEKNCLIHGQFPLQEKEAINPKYLKWNLDLPMLLFIYEKEEMTYINIYLRSNYEWARKYHHETKKKVINAKFSDIISTQLWIYYKDSSFQFIDFILGYNTILTNCNNENNNGATIVVTNDIIKFTPLGLCNMPPPMSLKQYQTEALLFCWYQQYLFGLGKGKIEIFSTNKREFELFTYISYNENIDHIKQFIFVPCIKVSKGVIIISFIDSQNKEAIALIILQIEYDCTNSFMIKKIKQFDHFECHSIPEVYHGLLFNSIISYDKTFKNNYFNEINPSQKQEAKKGLDMLVLESSKDTDEILAINDNEISFYYVSSNPKTNENDFVKYSYNTFSKELHQSPMSISHSSKETIIYLQSGLTFNNQEKIFFLTKNNRLYMDSTLLAMDVNSFALFKHFLLFTQLSSSPYSTLHIIDLNKKDFLPKSLNEALFRQNLDYKDFNMRTIERGSLIVTCSGVNVIFQLPRGNLETVSPRLIILHEIKSMIHHEKYEASFLLARKHKINLNYLYDIDPAAFMKNINKFIIQVNKPDYINLFINSLTLTRCEEYEILFGKNTSVNQNNEKINQLCDNIKKILQEKNNDTLKQHDYTNTILISYIKKTPPQYLEALKLVQQIKIDNKQNIAKADKALAFLCWIVKAETLFDFALKTYDFELVIMCAKHTQKDPKEYLSYLNKLQEINDKDPILMKYQINMDLKYHTDALIELSKGGLKHFDQVMDLVKKYELYDLGMNLFSNPIYELQYEEIYDAKAKSLYDKKDILNAGIAFMRSKDYTMALKCYLEIGKTNEVILLSTNEQLYQNLIELMDAGKLKHQKAELEKIFTFITSSTEQIKIFNDDQLKSLMTKLIDSMLQCQMYTSAYYSTITLMKLCAKHENQSIKDQSQFLSNQLSEQIDLGFSSFINQITLTSNTFKAKYPRLQKVQQLKKENPELFSRDYPSKENEDNVSDTGSIRSQSMKSGVSKASKKTKMKNPKRNLKEGSPMEEENLIAILKDLKIEDGVLETITDLISTLFLLKKTEKAIELKQAKENYITDVNKRLQGLYSIEQMKFINNNPQLNELFPELKLSYNANAQTKK